MATIDSCFLASPAAALALDLLRPSVFWVGRDCDIWDEEDWGLTGGGGDWAEDLLNLLNPTLKQLVGGAAEAWEDDAGEDDGVSGSTGGESAMGSRDWLEKVRDSPSMEYRDNWELGMVKLLSFPGDSSFKLPLRSTLSFASFKLFANGFLRCKRSLFSVSLSGELEISWRTFLPSPSELSLSGL